jgi:putative transposase
LLRIRYGTPIATGGSGEPPYHDAGILIEFRNDAHSAQTTRSHNAHFAGRFGAIYFITICCEKRGLSQLCDEKTSNVLFETAAIYHERTRWNLTVLLLMPDHLHALIGVDGRDSLSHLIRDYKRITAKMPGARWQRNFFDHRLRHDESLAEKFAHVCQNPVRAGLVRAEQDWSYVFIPGRSPQSW